MGTDLTEEAVHRAEAIPNRPQSGVDLYGLDAVIGRDEKAPRESGRPNASKLSAQQAIAARRIEQHLTVVPLPRLPTKAPAMGAAAPSRSQLEDAGRHNIGGYILFFVCVILPIAFAAAYYGFIASDQYAAEFRFSVRDAGRPTLPAAAGFAGLLGGAMGGSANDNFMVTDYLTSRQVVNELEDRIKLIKLYSKPEIDWWARFNSALPMEKFVDYWQRMTTARFDMITGIASAEVRAFSPQDALLIANTLVSLSENLVNNIMTRSQVDAVRFAEKEVATAQDRLKRVRGEVTEYREKFGVIDPTTSVAASNSALTQTQRANLAQLETQLSTLLAQNLQPNAPAIVGLRTQIKSTKDQLARTESDVARGNNGSALSKIVGDYEQLNLEVQFAQAMVTSTMQSLEQARANASAQQLYITPYVRPTLPTSSVYPRRFVSVLTVGLLAFGFWLITLMIGRSVRERFG